MEDTTSSPKKGWELTQKSFEELLACLNPDRELAAEKYELIRRKLITFFESRGCLSPEDYADITINKVARKVSEGVNIYTSDPAHFFTGVARNALHEYWEEHTKRQSRLQNLPLFNPFAKPSDDVKEKQMECLQHCIKQLPPKHYELIIQYYQGETSTKIANRKKLSEQLGIPMNSLRIRVLRIRKKVEMCVIDCLKQLEGT
jgi:DNA-directed RNA polymerase specialized sigma24 family protein